MTRGRAWILSLPGVYSLKERGKKVPRAGRGGSGHGSHGLKEVAAGNRGAVTRSCVFHEHEFKI